MPTEIPIFARFFQENFMSINRQQKHVIFFGEDAATSDLAQGFIESSQINELRCDVWHEFGTGWQSTAEAIKLVNMARYPDTHLVLVIDLDRRGAHHIDFLKQEINQSPYKDRVYVIGGTKDAQALQRSFSPANSIGKVSVQEVGRSIADQCFKDESCIEGVWSDPSLSYNADELVRLCRKVKDVIFK